jgi:DnaK suppressor protein
VTAVETSKKKATSKVVATTAEQKDKPAAKKAASKPSTAAAKTTAGSKTRAVPPEPTKAAEATAAVTKAASNKTMPTTTSAPTSIVTKRDPKLANNWKTKPLEELTDAEIVAMSDDEYMNDVQMAYFRAKLVKLKQDMHQNAGETAENLREDTVVVPDPADRATIEEEHALELRTRDRERKLLKKIEQSIARIDAGDYGYCDETGEPIGVPRLLARPTATLSLEAQQRRELKQKMFGD